MYKLFAVWFHLAFLVMFCCKVLIYKPGMTHYRVGKTLSGSFLQPSFLYDISYQVRLDQSLSCFQEIMIIYTWLIKHKGEILAISER